MKLWIFPLTVVDCTADPHPVSFDGLEDALEAICRVCESDLVQAIRSVTLTLDTDDGEVTYETEHATGSLLITRRRAPGSTPASTISPRPRCRPNGTCRPAFWGSRKPSG